MIETHHYFILQLKKRIRSAERL